MEASQSQSIPDLLVAHLSRDLVLGVAEALDAGAAMAFPPVEDMDVGHRSSALGQLRHFLMNERFAEALAVAGASPSQIRGNEVVVGKKGIFRIARFNIAKGPWYNARRSQTRRSLAEANRAIEQLVLPDLFAPPEPITTATVFFVAVFSGKLSESPERPLSLEIAVPDREMKTWLFRETINTFVSRYNSNPSSSQEDRAHPVLKTKRTKKDQGE